jgi:hypothetical protein
MDDNEIANRFTFHPASEVTGRSHKAIRDACYTLAIDLNGLLPESREKSLAITHLEEVMFWGNAAIARQSNG